MPLFNSIQRTRETELVVLFQDESCPLHEWDDLMSGAEFEYAVLPSLGRVGRGVRRTYMSYGLTRHLKRFRPHVVVVGGFNQPIAYLALLCRRFFGYEAWLWIESTLSDARAAGGLRDRLKRWAVANSNGVLVPGQAAETYATALGAEPGTVRRAPNAVDVRGIGAMADQARPDRRAIRAGLPVHGTVFTYVGRMVEEKGVGDLLDAFGIASGALSDEGLEGSLLLVGTGPELEPLLARARSHGIRNVVSTGFVQPPGLPSLLTASDVVVLPTWSDPWGMTINEAQACGLPVITTRVAGAAPDLVGGTGAGLMVEERAPAMLAQAMLRLARDSGLRATMGATARTVAEDYLPEGMARAFVDLVAEARGARVW
jgi:glycosyltransferase involved in cell wall biosynthesis